MSNSNRRNLFLSSTCALLLLTSCGGSRSSNESVTTVAEKADPALVQSIIEGIVPILAEKGEVNRSCVSSILQDMPPSDISALADSASPEMAGLLADLSQCVTAPTTTLDPANSPTAGALQLCSDMYKNVTGGLLKPEYEENDNFLSLASHAVKLEATENGFYNFLGITEGKCNMFAADPSIVVASDFQSGYIAMREFASKWINEWCYDLNRKCVRVDKLQPPK
jgi:hypothetical protein